MREQAILRPTSERWSEHAKTPMGEARAKS
jgi:hypothetical protein